MDRLGLDQLDLCQQLPAIGVLEVLHRSHVDRHFHLRQVPDDPVGAGVHGLGEDQRAMGLVELLGQFRLEPLPEGCPQGAGNAAASFRGQSVTNDTQAAAQFTASISGVPESHDGSTTFTFELRFSETPRKGFSYKTLRDHALTVAGGEVAKARRREEGKNVLWEIHVTPDGDGEGLRRAATAHSLQQSTPRCSRRFSPAFGVVPAAVRPVGGGDSPSPENRSHHRAAVVEARRAAPLPEPHGASGPGRLPGARPPVHRLRRPAPEVSPSLQRMLDRNVHVSGVQMYGSLYTHTYVQRDRQVPKESAETQAELCTTESRQEPRLAAILNWGVLCDQ